MSPERNMTLGGLQLVVAAMAGGIVAFGTVVLAIGSRMNQQADIANTLLPVLGLVVLGEVGAYLVLRAVCYKQAGQELDTNLSPEDAETRALTLFQNLVLIRSAMAEGAGLFGLVIAMISGLKLVLVVPGLSLLVLLLGFPTRDKLRAFVAKAGGKNPYSA